MCSLLFKKSKYFELAHDIDAVLNLALGLFPLFIMYGSY